MSRRFLASAALLLLALGGMVATSRAPAATSQGLADRTPASNDVAPEGYKFGSAVTMSGEITATMFRFYAAGGPVAQTFLPVVYAIGAGGVPATLVSQGGQVTVEAGREAGWVEAPLPETVLHAGSYVLALISGPSGRGGRIYYSSGGHSYWNDNRFPDPSASWGATHESNGVTWAFALSSSASASSAPPVVPVAERGSCPAFPAFPNKTCTGVPAGTVLSDYVNGDVTRDNAIISNVRITSTIVVRANNVTFRNCLIQPNGPVAVAVEQGHNGLTLENCTFKSGGFVAPFSGLTLRRVLVDPDPGAYRSDGIVVGFSSIGHNGQNVLIEDSYIGPQWGGGGAEPDHPDGLQFWGFGKVSNVTIRHNWVDSSNTNPDRSAIPVGSCAFLADATYVAVTFEYNYCVKSGDVGGYFHLRLLSNDSTGGHIIRGNRFGNRGSTTPVDLFRATPSVWEDNRYADNDELIPEPEVRG